MMKNMNAIYNDKLTEIAHRYNDLSILTNTRDSSRYVNNLRFQRQSSLNVIYNLRNIHVKR